jgi:hypothetical protein
MWKLRLADIVALAHAIGTVCRIMPVCIHTPEKQDRNRAPIASRPPNAIWRVEFGGRGI